MSSANPSGQRWSRWPRWPRWATVALVALAVAIFLALDVDPGPSWLDVVSPCLGRPASCKGK